MLACLSRDRSPRGRLQRDRGSRLALLAPLLLVEFVLLLVDASLRQGLQGIPLPSMAMLATGLGSKQHPLYLLDLLLHGQLPGEHREARG